MITKLNNRHDNSYAEYLTYGNIKEQGSLYSYRFVYNTYIYYLL